MPWPLGYLHKFSALKTAADRYVNTPNNVSIDAYGNADLRTEPIVISVAALREPRWYIVQIGDMFDEIVYNIGGSKGAEPGLFCLTGPDYHGPIPANMKEIKVRTTMAVVANRVFVNGEADIPAARAVQAGIHMLPLSVFQRQGLKYEIPKSDPARLAFVPTAPESLRLFDQIGFGMTRFLSASDDYADPMVVSFHRIGLSVAKGFAWQALDDAPKRGLASCFPGVRHQIVHRLFTFLSSGQARAIFTSRVPDRRGRNYCGPHIGASVPIGHCPPLPAAHEVAIRAAGARLRPAGGQFHRRRRSIAAFRSKFACMCIQNCGVVLNSPARRMAESAVTPRLHRTSSLTRTVDMPSFCAAAA